MGGGRLGKLLQCLAGNGFVGDQDIDRLDGNVEQRLVLDLLGLAEQVDDELAGAGDRDDIAGLQHEVGIGVGNLLAAADTLDQQAAVGHAGFGLRDGPADIGRIRPDDVGAHFPVAPRRQHVLAAGAAAHLGFILGASLRQIDAEQPRPELGQDDRRADGAEDIGDGVTDRNLVGETLGLIGRQAEPHDLVGGNSDRSRDGLRAGIQSRRVAEIEAGELRAQVRNDQAERQHDQGKADLLRPFARQALEELRPDAVADRKQEQQKEDRLHVRRDGDGQLADRHGGQAVSP